MNLTPEELARDPNTSLDILERLAKTSKDDLVLAAVAENPNTSPELLIELFDRYPYQVLNNPALELILLEQPDIIEKFCERNKYFFNCWRIPSLILDWAVININYFEVCQAIASNQLIPVFYLEKIWFSGNIDVRGSIARNISTPIFCLEQLY